MVRFGFRWPYFPCPKDGKGRHSVIIFNNYLPICILIISKIIKRYYYLSNLIVTTIIDSKEHLIGNSTRGGCIDEQLYYMV